MIQMDTKIAARVQSIMGGSYFKGDPKSTFEGYAANRLLRGSLESFFATNLPAIEAFNKASVDKHGQSIPLFDQNMVDIRKQGIDLLRQLASVPEINDIGKGNPLMAGFLKGATVNTTSSQSDATGESGPQYKPSIIEKALSSLGIKGETTRSLIAEGIADPTTNAVMGELNLESLPKDKLSKIIQNEITIADEAKKAEEEAAAESEKIAEEADSEEIQLAIDEAVEEAIEELPESADAEARDFAKEEAIDDTVFRFSFAA